MKTRTRTPDRRRQPLSRRQFVVTALTAAGGFALGIATPRAARAASLATRPWSPETAAGDRTTYG